MWYIPCSICRRPVERFSKIDKATCFECKRERGKLYTREYQKLHPKKTKENLYLRKLKENEKTINQES